MKLDKMEIFSDAQAGAGTDTTVVSTNVIDTGSDRGTAGRDVGLAAEDIWLNATVIAAAVGGTSVQVLLQTSDAENFGSGVTEIPLSGAVAVADLTAGKRVVRARLPLGLKRYLRIGYKNVGAVTTITWKTFLTHGVQAEDNLVPAPYSF